MIVTHRKAAHILKNWDLEKAEITDIYYPGTGNKNDSACYAGEEYVLKYTANPGKLQNHIQLSGALRDIGLLTAEPVQTNQGRDYVQDGELYFYLTRRLLGNQIMSRSIGAEDGRFIGRIIGQLHLALRQVEACLAEADLLASLRDWALPRTKDALRLPDDFCRELLDSLTALYPGLPRQIIHRDPNPGNIICAENRWGFIDFELSERNARIYDPCYAATAVLSERFSGEDDGWMDIYRSIICGYDSVIHLTADERRAIPYVIIANQLVCTAWFAEQEKYAQLYETNKAMTLWLVDRFEELKDI